MPKLQDLQLLPLQRLPLLQLQLQLPNFCQFYRKILKTTTVATALVAMAAAAEVVVITPVQPQLFFVKFDCIKKSSYGHFGKKSY